MYGSKPVAGAHSWITAVAVWERANPRRPKQYRDDPGYPRIIGRGRSQQTVRRGPNGSVIFSLYETDCVTWHEDNSVSLVAYASKLTNQFARALLPSGIYPHYTWPVEPVIAMYGWDGPFYCVPDGLRLRPGPARFDDGTDDGRDWHVDQSGPFEQFKVVRLDHAKARAALKTSNYHDFMAWSRASAALKIPYPDFFHTVGEEAYNALADRERWPHLRGLDPAHLREWIYAEAGCYFIERKDALNRHELESAKRSDRLSEHVR